MTPSVERRREVRHPTEDIVFVPRTLIIAGIALIAIALGASGHGLWWLIGLVWAFGGVGGARHACHRRHSARRGPVTRGDASPPPDASPATTPDPTHDRHEAFPTR